jgi:hypothetical protein
VFTTICEIAALFPSSVICTTPARDRAAIPTLHLDIQVALRIPELPIQAIHLAGSVQLMIAGHQHGHGPWTVGSSYYLRPVMHASTVISQ